MRMGAAGIEAGSFFGDIRYRYDIYNAMPARLPTQRKTPFAIDPRPLDECSTAFAGLLACSRALRSLQVPGLVEANLPLKERQRGQAVAEYVEAIVLLQLAGGTCPEDMARLRSEAALQRGLGFEFPTPSAVRKFLNRFHDPQLELLRPSRKRQRSFIVPASEAVQALQRVLQGTVHQILRRYVAQQRPQSIATIDADATIIESHKRTARPHYEGGRGYQPVVAVWAETDLVLADQWRDGNVPARQDPLDCVRWAFEALPEGVRQRFFRGDSACHEADLLRWLSDPQRAREPAGRIGFAVSAFNSTELQKALRAVGRSEWTTWASEADGTQRQWAEVPFVPGQRGEKKEAWPLRYVGLRLLKPKGARFADGAHQHFHAVISNLDWRGDKLLDWHREKAGTIEHVHDAVKNHLAGGHVPSQKFGADAAWFKLALLAYNIASALTGLACADDESLRDAELKRLRFHLINVAGRLSRSQCKLRLRFLAAPETIQRILKVWEVFPLPTQATAFK
jgi:hypothetical protein